MTLTLGTYLQTAKTLFRPDSPAIAYLEKKIEESPNRQDEEVLADPRQMANLLYNLDEQGAKK